MKILVMPALAWAVFSALAVDAATFTASIVMLGTPTAVSTFVFAGELGGDTEFASLNVFLTTLASVASLFLLIALSELIRSGVLAGLVSSSALSEICSTESGCTIPLPALMRQQYYLFTRRESAVYGGRESDTC